MTDDWDPSIPEHKELAHQIEIGIGIVCASRFDGSHFEAVRC